jgi:ribokinase
MAVVMILGSLNVDLVTRVERHPAPGETVLGDGLVRVPGGKGANQAVAAAEAGAKVAMVGRVGDDAAGAAYVERMKHLGIDVRGLQVTPATPSGHALIAVSAEGENTIVVIPGANGQVGLADLGPLDALGPGDVLLTQLELPLDVIAQGVRTAHGRGARVVLNIAPYASLPAEVLALADPVVANEHEAKQLAADGADPASLLVTLGGDGARWGELTAATPKVEVVDTTGAGDAFCGALAAALAAGADNEAALTAAVAAGAQAVTRPGAQQGTL